MCPITVAFLWKMYHKMIVTRCFLLLLLLAICNSTAFAELKVVGSSTILPIIKKAGKEFTRATGIRVSVIGGGSSAGVKAIIKGEADIGMVSRELSDPEKSKLESHLIGHDRVVVVVNAANPLAQISRGQVVEIFSGIKNHWSSFGSSLALPVTLVVKRKSRGTRELFDRTFQLQDVQLPRQAIMAGSNVEVVVLVGTNPGAVGYVSVGTLDEAFRHEVPVKALGIVEGDTVERELQLVTSKSRRPEKEVRRFIEFMRRGGQLYVKEFHFSGIKAE